MANRRVVRWSVSAVGALAYLVSIGLGCRSASLSATEPDVRDKNGRERPDGTRLTSFVAWNYLTGKQSLLHENSEGHEIQCTGPPCLFESE